MQWSKIDWEHLIIYYKYTHPTQNKYNITSTIEPAWGPFDPAKSHIFLLAGVPQTSHFYCYVVHSNPWASFLCQIAVFSRFAVMSTCIELFSP